MVIFLLNLIGLEIMSYVVTSKCVKCKQCADACPIGCFYESNRQLVIKQDECIECGTCASLCPMQAIKHETEATLEEIRFNKEQSAKCPKALAT